MGAWSAHPASFCLEQPARGRAPLISQANSCTTPPNAPKLSALRPSFFPPRDGAERNPHLPARHLRHRARSVRLLCHRDASQTCPANICASSHCFRCDELIWRASVHSRLRSFPLIQPHLAEEPRLIPISIFSRSYHLVLHTVRLRVNYPPSNPIRSAQAVGTPSAHRLRGSVAAPCWFMCAGKDANLPLHRQIYERLHRLGADSSYSPP